MEDDKKNVQVVNGSFTPDMPDTLKIPEIENPDDREYEKVNIEVEGGM